MEKYKDLNQMLISKIHSKIPPGLKIANYLEDILDLGKDAVYRRIKGEVPFTLAETAKLSRNLGFSIDDILESQDQSKVIFDLQVNSHTNRTDSFHNMLEVYLGNLKEYSKAENLKYLIVFSYLSPIYFTERKHLMQYFYFKSLHHLKEDSINFKYSEAKLPSDTSLIIKQIRRLREDVGNFTIIISKNIYLNTIKDIQYYYLRKLISHEDLLLIKQDLLDSLSYIRLLIQKGVSPEGQQYEFYIQPQDTGYNDHFVEYDGKYRSTFFVYPSYPIVVTHTEACLVHKQWIESILKYSTLITRSNEMQQGEFLNKQEEYIMNMDKTMY